MYFLLDSCHAAFYQHGEILISLFLAGLLGGVTHCSGMCGPFVISQVKCSDNKNTFIKKISGKAILPYHFGRMTSYMIMGAIAAALNSQIIGTYAQKIISFFFLNIAAFIFLASSLQKSVIIIRRDGLVYKIGSAIGKLSLPLFLNQNNIKRYILGFLLGFLPCSLVFASIMVVSTTGNVFTAMLAMAIFTIGTFPSLFLVGLGGNAAYRKWPNTMQKITRFVMAINGLVLFILAGNIIIKM